MEYETSSDCRTGILYWRLRNCLNEKIYIIYYENFYVNSKNQLRNLFTFLDLSYHADEINWHRYPHHDRSRKLMQNLKYEDKPVKIKLRNIKDLPLEVNDELNFAIRSIQFFYDLWEKRRI